jgi:hypothetical protein
VKQQLLIRADTMPMFAQQVADKSYSLVEPRLDWVRSKSSLVDGVCGKIGSVVPPVLATADKYIDTTVEVVSSRASAVQGSMASRVAPVQSKLVKIQGLIVDRSLTLVESSESMIDQLIPLPEKASDKKEQEQRTIVTRIARLPFRAPVRMTCLVRIKANGTVESVVLTSKQVLGVAAEKQAQFVQQMMARAKPLTDRVQSVADSGTTRIRARRASASKAVEDSREFIYIRVNNVLVRLRVEEAKDWTLSQGESVRSNIVALLLAAMQMGHSVGSRVIGQERTSFVFSKLRLPQELEDKPAAGAPQLVEPELKPIVG